MWLEAIITREDFVEVMREVLPVRLTLAEASAGEPSSADRWLELQPATAVALVPDRGLLVTCAAELGWSIAGISTPTIKVDQLRLLLRPEVVDRNRSHLLEFELQIEDAELHGVPALVDGTITRAVNGALAAKRLSWNFSETLSRTLGVGNIAEPLDGLRIDVQWGKQRIGADAMALIVSFKLHFLRDAAEGARTREAQQVGDGAAGTSRAPPLAAS
jgi:hypothetical protein